MLNKFTYIIIVFFVTFVRVNAKNPSFLNVDSGHIHHFDYRLHQKDTKNFIINHTQELKGMKFFSERNIYFIQFKKIPKSVLEKFCDYVLVNSRFVREKFNLQTFNLFLYGFEKSNLSKKNHVDGSNYVLFTNPRIE